MAKDSQSDSTEDDNASRVRPRDVEVDSQLSEDTGDVETPPMSPTKMDVKSRSLIS